MTVVIIPWFLAGSSLGAAGFHRMAITQIERQILVIGIDAGIEHVDMNAGPLIVVQVSTDAIPQGVVCSPDGSSAVPSSLPQPVFMNTLNGRLQSDAGPGRLNQNKI